MSIHVPEHDVELYRESDHYLVSVNLTRYAPDAVRARCVDGRLHIEAEGTRQFRKTMSFPKPVNGKKASGTLHEGVLEVTIPFAEKRKIGRYDVPIRVALRA